MRAGLATALLCLALPAGLLAQASDRVGTRLDWGNVEVDLYPTTVFGLQLEIAAEASRPLQMVHGIKGGFAPESVLTWLNSAALVITPRALPRDSSEALLTPVLVSLSGDSIRMMRRSKGTKWEKRVLVLVDSPHSHHERFDLLVLPREASALLAGLQREAMLSGYDADSVAATALAEERDSIAATTHLGDASFTGTWADDPPRLLRAGPLRHPDPSRRGRVVMRFVIDTSGRPDPATIQTVTADHLIFIESARELILGSRFSPGRIRGTPVRVMVQQAINFGL